MSQGAEKVRDPDWWVEKQLDDFTVYLDRSDEQVLQQVLEECGDTSVKERCWKKTVVGGSGYRVQDVFSFEAGKLISRTARKLSGPESSVPVSETLPDGWRVLDPGKMYGLVEINTICKTIQAQMSGFDGRKKANGLIVIAGSTNSKKSKICRNLIYLYLNTLVKERLNGRQRRPHLITFEDPIEAQLYEAAAMTNGLRAVDYTPRQALGGSGSEKELIGVLNDALRQSVDLVYVGETRYKGDWPNLIEFAGTGHPVITTTHAGSLQETILKIIEASQADSAADFSRIGSRLLAVIHLKEFTLAKGSKAILPSLWVGNPMARMNLIGSGISSVLPNRPGNDSHPGCYGRAWFVEKLFSSERSDSRELLKEEEFRELKLQAIQSDLGGQ